MADEKLFKSRGRAKLAWKHSALGAGEQPWENRFISLTFSFHSMK